MKKLTLLFALIVFFANAYSQYSPKPNNPYKWYHITKDTTIKDIPMRGFSVCVYSWAGSYQNFSVDSVGHLLSAPIKSTIWFMEFANGVSAKMKVDPNNCLRNYADDFNVLPFGCENGEIGWSNEVNLYLAKRYGVHLSNVTE